MYPTAAARVGRRRSAFVEPLEPRALLTAYFVDTDADLAYVNTLNLTAGDQVLLRGGETFNGGLRFDAWDRGTAWNPIRVGSYDPDTGTTLDLAADASDRATINAGNSS